VNSERTAQLQVALASYDLKELRVQKLYWQERGTAIDCTCFCSGEKLLAQPVSEKDTGACTLQLGEISRTAAVIIKGELKRK